MFRIVTASIAALLLSGVLAVVMVETFLSTDALSRDEWLPYAAAAGAIVLLVAGFLVKPARPATDSQPNDVADLFGLLLISAGIWWMVGAGVCVVAFIREPYALTIAASVAAWVAVFGFLLWFAGKALRGT
jgi:hypothetical protein